MPSAGRPFTPELITRLVSAGILFAPLTLHAGVSSPERHEPPFPECFVVPESTSWHEPHATHLHMLEAIAGENLLAASYDTALAHSYLWHEFGDSHLILG
jgi:S-adenosylmethionine:tRNA ribosyltransferase-isomerase